MISFILLMGNLRLGMAKETQLKSWELGLKLKLSLKSKSVSICPSFHSYMAFPGGTSGKEPACQCRRHKRHRFDPWVGKIPWRRAWQPTPVFLPEESPWTEELGGLQSMGLRRVRHDRATKHSTALASLNPTDGSRTRLSREANMGGWRNQWMRECSSTKPLKCVPETAQLILKTL